MYLNPVKDVFTFPFSLIFKKHYFISKHCQQMQGLYFSMCRRRFCPTLFIAENINSYESGSIKGILKINRYRSVMLLAKAYKNLVNLEQ